MSGWSHLACFQASSLCRVYLPFTPCCGPCVHVPRVPVICKWTLGVFPPLVIVKDAAVNVRVQASFGFPFSILLGISLDHVVSLFNFLRYHQAVFHSGCTISHQPCTRVPVFSHPQKKKKNYNHPNGCELVSHCGFDLHFPNDQ